MASLVTAPAGDAMGIVFSGGGRVVSGASSMGGGSDMARKRNASENTEAFSAAAVVPKATLAPIHIKDRRMPESTRRRRLVTVTVNSLT